MTKTEQNRASITESLDPPFWAGTTDTWPRDVQHVVIRLNRAKRIRRPYSSNALSTSLWNRSPAKAWQFRMTVFGQKKTGWLRATHWCQSFPGQIWSVSCKQYQAVPGSTSIETSGHFRSLQVTSYHLSRKGHEGHDWTKALMDFCPPSSHSCCVSDSSSKIIGCQPVGCRPGPMFFSIENRSNATPANSCLDLWWPGTPQAPRTLRRQWWMSRKGPGNELEVGLQAPRTATAIDIQWFS